MSNETEKPSVTKISASETEVRPLDVLEPFEKAILDRLEQGTEQKEEPQVTQKTETKLNETPSAAVTAETKKEDAISKALESALGLKKEEVTVTEPKIKPAETPAEISEVEKLRAELAEVKAKEDATNEANMLKAEIDKVPEVERNLIAEKIGDVLQSATFKKLLALTTEERVALVISTAKNLNSEKIRDAYAKNATAKESLEGLLGTQTSPSTDVNTKADRVKELQQRALNGDYKAQVELASIDDPVIDRLVAMSMGE